MKDRYGLYVITFITLNRIYFCKKPGIETLRTYSQANNAGFLTAKVAVQQGLMKYVRLSVCVSVCLCHF